MAGRIQITKLLHRTKSKYNNKEYYNIHTDFLMITSCVPTFYKFNSKKDGIYVLKPCIVSERWSRKQPDKVADILGQMFFEASNHCATLKFKNNEEFKTKFHSLLNYRINNGAYNDYIITNQYNSQLFEDLDYKLCISEKMPNNKVLLVAQPRRNGFVSISKDRKKFGAVIIPQHFITIDLTDIG